MARLDIRASLRNLLRTNRRKPKNLKSIETSPILTCNSTPNFQAVPSGPLTPLTPVTPSMISPPTNIVTMPERVPPSTTIELKAASTTLTVGRDARMTRSYVVPPMPPIPTDDVEMERMAIRRELSDDSTLKKMRRRSTIALSTYSTHSAYYAPIHS